MAIFYAWWECFSFIFITFASLILEEQSIRIINQKHCLYNNEKTIFGNALCEHVDDALFQCLRYI